MAVEKRHDRRVAEGAVIAQTPVGGAESTAGATVTIVVSLGVPTPPPPDPIVPDVVGHTRARAEAVLVAADFAPAVEEASSERVPAGTVISQAPGGGNRRPLGTRVVITVSTGVPPVPVPALGGLCEPAASERVRAARLAADVVGVHSETVQPRCVVSQSPVGGALVPRGSSVTISISLGPPPVTVPNVVGRSVQEAEAVLGRAGFAMELLSRQHSSTVREGAVISQRPAGGTSAERGAEVGVVLSIGPAPVVVPNVVGRSVDDAQTTLRSAGLAMVDRRCFAESEVSSQNPRAGASVPQGTPVEVFDHCIG